MFLRHEGYLGAMGAFLRGTHNQPQPLSFQSFNENFSQITKMCVNSPSAVGALDTLPSELTAFPLLLKAEYKPDTLDLSDPSLQSYWINLLDRNLGSLVDLALEIQDSVENSTERARSFELMYRAHLQTLSKEPSAYGVLTVRGLLDLREQCLKEMGFLDVFDSIKKIENEKALEQLDQLLKQLDSISLDYQESSAEPSAEPHQPHSTLTPESLESEGRLIEELVSNILAGNMYDWGANAVQSLLTRGQIEFEKAKETVSRPTPFNQMSELKHSLIIKTYKKCVIFVDNSGADIILGILPFVRYLLGKGCACILASNTYPCVNDVTVCFLDKFC